MANFAPISGAAIQYQKNQGGAAASDFFVKLFAAGTTTPILMATDSTGGTLLVKARLNSTGYIRTEAGEDSIFIPHIDQEYKISLFPTEADADNNTSAVWTIDGLNAIGAKAGEDLAAYILDVANNTDPAKGSALVGHDLDGLAGITAFPTLVRTELNRQANVTLIATDPRFNIKGDGATDDEVAINLLLAYASSISNGTDRVQVIFPPAVYVHAGILLVKSNTKILNLGHFKFTGGDAIGTSTGIIAESNIEVTGGIWDSNNQQNDNTIGISNAGGAVCETIWIHDLEVRNSKHGGSHIANITDPQFIGSGGGKGITVQFGCKSVLVNNIIVNNCELGVSVEGKESDSGEVNGIVLDNIIINDAKYIGLFLTGQFTTPETTGDTVYAILNNIHLVNCSSGLNDFDSSPVSDDFGVITGNSAVGIKATNIQIRDESGRTESMRGSFRHCQFEITTDYFNGANVVNTAPYGGNLPGLASSLYNHIKVNVKARTADTTGYLLTGNGTQDPNKSKYEFEHISVTAGAYVTWVGIGLTNDIGTDCFVDLHNLQTGEERSILGTSGKLFTGAVVVEALTADNLAVSDAGILTIAAGVITITGSSHTIDTESAAASDDVDTINGLAEGQILILAAEDDTHTVVLKDGTGNLRLPGDVTLDNNQNHIMLIRKGPNVFALAPVAINT